MPVLACYRNDLGKYRKVRAAWSDGTEEADMESEISIYDEGRDCYVWPEGWDEWNEAEEVHYYLSGRKITHWQPLPEDPAE